MGDTICENRVARRDYEILDTIEAGIALTGTEVKSLRTGRIDLRDCYALVKNNEIFLIGFHIPPYSHGNIHNVDPVRTRKLLLHRAEIQRLAGEVAQKSHVLVPLNLHWNSRNVAKLSLGIAKPKKSYDKRADLKKRETNREMERALHYKK